MTWEDYMFSCGLVFGSLEYIAQINKDLFMKEYQVLWLFMIPASFSSLSACTH